MRNSLSARDFASVLSFVAPSEHDPKVPAMLIPNRDYTARERSVCELLAPLVNVRRMLNVGMRYPGDPRNLWWITICQANGTETHVLEVFAPNCRELRAAGVENVTCGDVRDVRKLYDRPFDVILWWHGPEQIEHAEAPAVIDELWRLTEGTLILGCPLGDERQGICYGNPHERQLSYWQPEDLAAMGFRTRVVRDGQPFPHITAWRSRDESTVESKSTDADSSAASRAAMECSTATQADASVAESSVSAIGSDALSSSCSFSEPASCVSMAVTLDVTGDPTADDAWPSKPVSSPTAELSGDVMTRFPLPDCESTQIVCHSSIDRPNPHDARIEAEPSQPIRRVAIIFDERTRPDTTRIYCRKALQSLVEVEYFHPDDVANVPRTGFDLYLVIDDGLDYPLPVELRPMAYWAIETHFDFDRCLQRAMQVDFVFAAQKDDTERMRKAGVATAQWLPLACDPEIHGQRDAAKERDLCFVGNVPAGPRADLLRLLQQYFKDIYVGNSNCEELARIYSATRIVFNRSRGSDVNRRVFEALASGSLLITNDLTENGQDELFRDGVHFATYRIGEELLDKLRYYLRHNELRERIAAAGRAEVLAKHTYRHRMEELLASVEATVYRSRGKAMVGNVISGVLMSTEQGAVPQYGYSGAEQNGDEQMFLAAQCLMATIGDPKSNIRIPKSAHDPSYFEFDRPELLALIPRTAATVLEVGCGRGRLGESLKARQSCEVNGIELDEEAATIARGRLDRVFVGDMEQMDLDLCSEYYDAVVCGDVLEHFRDPEKQLARIRLWLKPTGVVIASIPNVRHHSVVRSLLDGNWTYEPAGLLDATHLHFFTRRNIQELFEKAGYAVTRWAAVPGPGYEEWVQQGRPLNIDLGRTQLTGLPEPEVEEFFIYQWLITATPTHFKSEPKPVQLPPVEQPRPAAPGIAPTSGVEPGGQPAVLPAIAKEVGCRSPSVRLPSCLLLMVTYNRLEYTKLALESVLALDYPDLMIVLWDNASTDGTVDYVRQRLRDESRARLIASPENRGVVYPMNAVWWADHGAEMLVKIDNDTWVPPDLLRRLAECHGRSKRFGVLSGFHFRAEGEALINVDGIQEFDGVRILAQPHVGGCAVMVSRAVLGRLGPIPCRPEGQESPFMDFGWTFYQQKMTEQGLVNGYPWPLIHVDHMEDTRSPRCVRTDEHQAYKQALRGMSLEQFTQEMCVWRPSWMQKDGGNGKGVPFAEPGHSGNGHSNPIQVVPAVQRVPLASSGSSTLQRGNGRQTAPPNEIGSRPMVAATTRVSPMKFSQDFREDFEQFAFFGPPFAFSRFADGERAICMGQPIQGADGWTYAGGSSQFREALLAALRFNAPDYYLGVSDACCDPAAKNWYLQQITVPLRQVTFSNIFVNGNYPRFRQLDLSAAAIVASQGGDYWVPDDAMNTTFDIDRLVERLLQVDRTILVSAGPASCVIIHRYWQRATPQKRQVIVDVGSAIDEWTKGRKTRQYQMPGTRTSELVCTW